MTPQHLSEEQVAKIQQHLSQILASSSFATSDRSQKFLEFVVKHSLTGDYESLRERVIGSQIFGRPIDYETSSDAIVRVKANEVRKRLAQYYQNTPIKFPLRIELPAGSYVPEFHWLSEEPDEAKIVVVAVPPAAPVRRWNWVYIGGVAAGLLLLVAAGFLLRQRVSTRSELNDFWGPILNEKQPAIICLGRTEGFWISPHLLERIERNPASVSVGTNDVVRFQDETLANGNLRAILSITRFLDRQGKSAEVEWGSEVPAEELRRNTVIFMGAFNNPWTLELTKGLRYTFESEQTGDQANYLIRDTMGAGRSWSMRDVYPRPIKKDYALITRIFDRSRDRTIIMVAGINQFGTQVAGEFLVDPVSWKELAKDLSSGWQQKNLQVVLEVSVTGRKPIQSKVVATHIW